MDEPATLFPLSDQDDGAWRRVLRAVRKLPADRLRQCTEGSVEYCRSLHLLHETTESLWDFSWSKMEKQLERELVRHENSERQITSLTQRLQSSEQQRGELTTLVTAMEQQIQVRDARVAELEHELHMRNLQLVERTAEMVNAQNAVGNLAQMLLEQDQAVQHLEGHVQQLEGHVQAILNAPPPVPVGNPVECVADADEAPREEE